LIHELGTSLSFLFKFITIHLPKATADSIPLVVALKEGMKEFLRGSRRIAVPREFHK
jgi:hypothetical protein